MKEFQFFFGNVTYMGDDIDLLCSALESIEQNTLLPDEVIIVKDGPLSKRHNDLLNLFSSKRTVPINVIENEKNLGLADL